MDGYRAKTFPTAAARLRYRAAALDPATGRLAYPAASGEGCFGIFQSDVSQTDITRFTLVDVDAVYDGVFRGELGATITEGTPLCGQATDGQLIDARPSLNVTSTPTLSDVLFTAKKGGIASRDISVTFVVSGLGTSLAVTVTSHDISVAVATDASGAATSTAAEVAAAVNASAAAAALVLATAEGAGSGVVEANSQAWLSGGGDVIALALAGGADGETIPILVQGGGA